MANQLTKNLVVSILILAVTLAMVSGVAGYVISQRVGQVAYAASALAAVVVGLAGSLSLLVTMRATGTGDHGTGDHGNQAGVTALLMAMLLRIGLPLAAVVILIQLGTQLGGETQVGAGGDTRAGWMVRLGEAGFFGLVVVHYLVALLVETFLSVRWLSRQGSISRQPCHSPQERAPQERAPQERAPQERAKAKAGSF